MMAGKKGGAHERKEKCANCGGVVTVAWQVALRVDSVDRASNNLTRSWRWATACTGCMWERAPRGKRQGIRGPRLPNEYVPPRRIA